MADSGSAMQTLIFGIGYKMRSGKDTVASIIQKERGTEYDIRIYHFADALKREVNTAAFNAGGMRNLFGDIHEFMQENGNFISLPSWVQYDPAAPTDDPLCPLGKQRTLLQWWGAEYRRAANPAYWVNFLIKSLVKDRPEIALVPDTRFENELELCREHGEVIKVVRPGTASGYPTHVSETALDHVPDENWSAIILNESTLEVLQERTLLAFDSLMEKENA